MLTSQSNLKLVVQAVLTKPETELISSKCKCELSKYINCHKTDLVTTGTCNYDLNWDNLSGENGCPSNALYLKL